MVKPGNINCHRVASLVVAIRVVDGRERGAHLGRIAEAAVGRNVLIRGLVGVGEVHNIVEATLANLRGKHVGHRPLLVAH